MKARVTLGRPVLRRVRTVGALGWVVALVAVISLGGWLSSALWSLVLPIVVWATLRSGLHGALVSCGTVTLSACLLSVLAQDHALHGLPYATWLLHALSVVVAAWGCGGLVALAMAKHTTNVEAERSELQDLRNVLRACPSALSAVDVQGRVTLWNPAAEKLFGWTAQEVLGKSPAIVPAAKREEFLEACEAAQRGEPPEGKATVRRSRDGSMLAVRLRAAPLCTESGKVIGTVSAFEDLRPVRALQAESERLWAILDKNPGSVIIAEPGGRIRYMNEAARRLLGFEAHEDCTTLAISDLLPEAMLGKAFEEVIPALEVHGIWRGETGFRHRDGHAIPVQQVALGHQNADGGLEYYSSVAYELSERVEVERQLRQAEEKLLQAQRMEVVGMLAGGIAHDFNNLITVMLGASDLALSKLPADHAARKEILDVQRVSERASTLARQLLAFGRKRSRLGGVVELNAVVADLEGIVKRVIGPRTQLRLLLDSDVGSVQVDAGELEQVLMNLVVNARDAMPDGGTVTIETSHEELMLEAAADAHGMRASALAEGDDGEEELGAYVRLTVRDTGDGMGTQTQTRLFEPFFTTKEIGKGTGIGLSTVHRIVDQAGGFVSVQSAKGQGAAFHVYLPRVEAEAAQDARALEDDATSGRGEESILVVEGEQVVRELIERVLTERGYGVTALPDAEAVSRLDAASLAGMKLALIDSMLPERSGLRLAQQLHSEVPRMPFVVMSSGQLDRGNFRDDPALAPPVYLMKPFSAEELARRVRQALDQGTVQSLQAPSG